MAVNLQPTYNVTQPIALPGMPATMTSWDGDTYIVDKHARQPASASASPAASRSAPTRSAS